MVMTKQWTLTLSLTCSDVVKRAFVGRRISEQTRVGSRQLEEVEARQVSGSCSRPTRAALPR